MMQAKLNMGPEGCLILYRVNRRDETTKFPTRWLCIAIFADFPAFFFTIGGDFNE